MKFERKLSDKEYLFDIYEPNLPSFLKEFLETEEMRRLMDVGMHCGCEYTSFPLFSFVHPYSRWLHSAGVGLIVWHYTQDIAQSVAGLLHDIATPVFAHVVDFLNGDPIRQETTEEGTLERIQGAEDIQCLLKKYGLKTEDVADYHLYPIADNPAPALSADRLEYTLGNFYCRGIKSRKEIARMYDNLLCLPNEQGIVELTFASRELAEEFTLASLENSRMYTADEDRFCMQYLADLLKCGLEWGILSPQDLDSTETEVIGRLTTDERSAKLWEDDGGFCRIGAGDRKPEGRYSVRVPSKLRYIDPLCLPDDTSRKPVRISRLSRAVEKQIEQFNNTSFDRWIWAEEADDGLGRFA